MYLKKEDAPFERVDAQLVVGTLLGKAANALALGGDRISADITKVHILEVGQTADHATRSGVHPARPPPRTMGMG